MVWGLILEPGKRYAQNVKSTFKITNAALDLNTADTNEPTAVFTGVDDLEFTLCNLSKRIPHHTIDLILTAGEKISLFTKGTASVHLTGYLIPEEEEIMEVGSDEEEDEEEEVPALQEIKPKKVKEKKEVPVQVKKRKNEELDLSQQKKAKKPEKAINESSEEEDDESDEEGVSNAVEEESDDDDLEEEDTSEEEQEVVIAPKKVKAKHELKTPDKGKSPKEVKTPVTLPNGTPTATPISTSGKKKKKDKTPKVAGATPGTPQESPQKKTLPGGVMIDDIRVGTGPVAKAGRFVSVYYTGRLKQNNKQFDATTQGPGFKFRLGQNEVIKGWDLGLVGMKVGGKRRIICPPHVAYGKQGQPPAIPSNSTLVFEVELKSVN